MDTDLEAKVKNCHSCQLNPWEYTANPWNRLHVDFASPFLGHMFLVIVDSHTKWLEVFQMQNITSRKTVERLRSCFATHGLPDCIVSNNGPTLTSEEFREFTSANDIRHIFVEPYHPSSNGLAEKAVQSFRKGMKRMQPAPLQLRLTRWLTKYRLTPHSTTNRSPAEILLRRRPKSRLDLIRPSTQQHYQHAKDRTFNPGDRVLVRNLAPEPTWLPANCSNAQAWYRPWPSYPMAVSCVVIKIVF